MVSSAFLFSRFYLCVGVLCGLFVVCLFFVGGGGEGLLTVYYDDGDGDDGYYCGLLTNVTDQKLRVS